MALMDQATAPPPPEGEPFAARDPRQFVPADQHDAIDRTVAAGMKLMYSSEMADERQAAIKGQEPVPKRIADNVTGLMLTLDGHSKGGIPPAVIFPAAVMLASEAATLLSKAGQQVTQQDYSESLQILYVQLGKKLGASDDELMHGATNALQRSPGDTPLGGPDEPPSPMGGPEPVDPAAAPPVDPAVPPPTV
ncbi:MAG: hypothetical protein ABIO71_11885 [Caldimonas sp.]